MWILESLSRIPMRRVFLLLSTTLGAGFLLLAHFFAINALAHPLTYALLALDLHLLNRNNVPVWKACLWIPSTYVMAYYLIPRYMLMFAASFTLAAGWALYRTGFRNWKWGVSAVLLYLTFLIVTVWQHMAFVYAYIPSVAVPLVHGLIFAFCAGASMLPFALRKDRVEEALDSTPWVPRSEPEALAKQTNDLYHMIRNQLEVEPALQNELEDFCEKAVLLSRRLQDLQRELSRTDPEELENQIGALKTKAESVSDSVARKQYEQALANKEKQKKQFESLHNKAERLRGQLLHYLSGLENMRFAYANREFRTAGDNKESIEFFLNLTRADNVYDASEAYQQLL